MIKRQEFTWRPGGCESHDDCNCDLYVDFPALGIPPIIEKRVTVHRRTIREMYASVKARLVASYYMVSGTLVPKTFDMTMYMDYLREYNTPPSQVCVSPPFPVVNRARECDIKPCEVWQPLVRRVEENYWARYGNYTQYRDEAVPPQTSVFVPSLKSMCRKLLSWEDTVFGEMYGYKRVIHTMSYFPLEKQLRLYGEFNVNTMYRGPSEDIMWGYTSGALNWMNFQMDVYKNHNSLFIDYNPHQMIRQTKLYTSAGIGAGGSVIGEVDGEKVKVVSSGRKIFCAESAMRKTHDILTGIRKHDIRVYKAIVAVIKTKFEWKQGQFKTRTQLMEMLLKLREFFIPDLSHSYIGVITNEARSLLERNNIIRIGMKFWHGGAYSLFMYLNGNLPDMIYVDGDIEGLDKHIMDWMLLLYCHNVFPYYRWDDMSPRDQEFLQELLILWSANVCSKLVCHIGSFWRFMTGQMYSGGKETSHGDSWIMAFIFFCYCEHIKARNPSRARLIDEFLALMIITIVTYGDDHIWCAPMILSDIMNHVSWKDFLWEFCRMKLRDHNIYKSLISVPDGTGRLKVRGPKFLKRHFIVNTIDPELAPILPYKEIDEQMVKMFTTDSPVAAELILSTIGFAWDTMGTNDPAYDVIEDFFVLLSSYDSRTPAEVLKSMDLTSVDKTRLRRLIRKIGISADELFDHFPTRSELLSRHKLDLEKASHFVSLDSLSTVKKQQIYVFDEDEGFDSY